MKSDREYNGIVGSSNRIKYHNIAVTYRTKARISGWCNSYPTNVIEYFTFPNFNLGGHVKNEQISAYPGSLFHKFDPMGKNK